MDKKLLIGALACAIGSLIGSVVAYALRYYWYVGLFVGMTSGGIIAYLGSDIRTVVESISTAWDKARGWKLTPTQKDDLKLLIRHLIAYMPSSISFCLLISLPFLFLFGLKDYLVAALTIGILAGGGVAFSSTYGYSRLEMGLDGKDGKKEARKLFLYCNPISVFLIWPIIGIVFVLWKSPIVIIWLWKNVHKEIWITIKSIAFALKTTAMFFWHLYILIHTRDRKMVLVDAMAGTVMGYLAGILTNNVILLCLTGSSAGAIFFVVNRELIAIHFLKLKPCEAK